MPLIIILGIILVIVIWMTSLYNGLVRLRNRRQNAFADIDVQLRQRHDLVPQLVDTVKGYATHERELLTRITEARTAAMAATTIDDKIKAEQQLSTALAGLKVQVEAYPDLKANQNFLELQQALQNIEGDLGNSRRYYNATVRDYNTSIQQFPGVILANMTGFKPREFFELEDKAEAKNIEVKF